MKLVFGWMGEGSFTAANSDGWMLQTFDCHYRIAYNLEDLMALSSEEEFTQEVIDSWYPTTVPFVAGFVSQTDATINSYVEQPAEVLQLDVTFSDEAISTVASFVVAGTIALTLVF